MPGMLLSVLVMPKFSVIVLNWNGQHFLETCLLALRRQTFRDFETILVDNGSEDGSARYVREHFPEISLIELDRNVGFASGNIEGYRQAHGEVIVLLNNDTEADPLWLHELNKAALEFPDISTFASKMLYFDERQKIDNCGFALTAAGSTIDIGRDELDGPAWSKPRAVFGACGGAAAYRRSMLESTGFLDPEFFMTYEDVDLSFRAQLLGFKCFFIPSAIVYHRYRATMKSHPARQVFFSQRNIEFVYLKNMPVGLILRFFPERFLYEVGSGIYFLAKGRGGAYLKAKMDALRKMGPMLRQRQGVQARRVLSNGEIRSRMLRNGGFGTKWRKLSALFGSSKSQVEKSQSAF
jgi:GT2 family glycosyltransferase